MLVRSNRVRRAPVAATTLAAVLALGACSSSNNASSSGTTTTSAASSSTTAGSTQGSTKGTTAGSTPGSAPTTDGNFMSGGLGLEVLQTGFEAEVEEALADAANRGFSEISAPGAVMAIRQGDTTWMATIGAKEDDGDEPITADVHQRIGSLTKTFTVTALLQLAESGELSLDDPISKYVEGMPNGDATLADLAAMRSGIPSYTFDEDFQKTLFTSPDTVWTPQELVDIVKGEEPMFAPGTETYYSNTNTVLLGMVIEKVAGKPLREVIDENVIAKLGLTGTAFPEAAEFPEPRAHGYTVQGSEDGKIRDATEWNPSWGWAAGAMTSTIDDLLVYGHELVAGDVLLGADMQKERIDSFDFSIEPNSPEKAYGLGLGLANGWYGHTGELPGYNTVMQHHLDEDITIVVMVNSDISSGDCPADAPTTSGGRTTGPCMNPAVHLANILSAAFGYPLDESDT